MCELHTFCEVSRLVRLPCFGLPVYTDQQQSDCSQHVQVIHSHFFRIYSKLPWPFERNDYVQLADGMTGVAQPMALTLSYVQALLLAALRPRHPKIPLLLEMDWKSHSVNDSCCRLQSPRADCSVHIDMDILSRCSQNRWCSNAAPARAI